MKDMVSDAPVIRAVNRLISEAVDARASDIHVEPGRGSPHRAIPHRRRAPGAAGAARGHARALRVAYQGHVRPQHRRAAPCRRMGACVSRCVAMRSTCASRRRPPIHGESVVLRVLDRSHLALDFTVLGFNGAIADEIRRALHRPHGIVLVTGPTGSGKTTTLYAALGELNDRGRKLLTVEDPIEYRLQGVVQTHGQSGHRLYVQLRAALLPAPGPGRDDGRRNPRRRDCRHRGSGRADRACHSVDAAHQYRGRRGQPPARHGRGAVSAQRRHECGARPAARAAAVSCLSRAPRPRDIEAAREQGVLARDRAARRCCGAGAAAMPVADRAIAAGSRSWNCWW